MSELQPTDGELIHAIESSWDAMTSADDRWSEDNPALGQCAVTACVYQDYRGGEIMAAKAVQPDGSRESHFFNRLDEDGSRDIDLTSRQFPDGTVMTEIGPKTRGHKTTRDFMLSDYPFELRYTRLKDKVAVELAFPEVSAKGIQNKSAEQIYYPNTDIPQ